MVAGIYAGNPRQPRREYALPFRCDCSIPTSTERRTEAVHFRLGHRHLWGSQRGDVDGIVVARHGLYGRCRPRLGSGCQLRQGSRRECDAPAARDRTRWGRGGVTESHAAVSLLRRRSRRLWQSVHQLDSPPRSDWFLSLRIGTSVVDGCGQCGIAERGHERGV